MKKAVAVLACVVFVGFSGQVMADARVTKFPIVLAHGMGGFDDILGYDYWGDDWGVYVYDGCSLLEINGCNNDISPSQKSYVAQVTPFQTSEQRGYQLYQQILNYMATTGTTGVNLIGHSQGGIDLRKAARLLYENKGYNVVKYGISLASPHRGSPVAKHVLSLGAGVTSVLNALATYYGNVVYGSGNDGYAALKQLIYNDWSSTDGVTTGMKAYNSLYPISSAYIARARSVITAQQGIGLNPALYLAKQAFMDIDGDGYATSDADNDGAGGIGNGNKKDNDDDGLVGINSAQMGYRLQYVDCFACLNYFNTRTETGNNVNLNSPESSVMMTSKSYVVAQDHVDIIGVGPDMFDEMEFYAGLADFIGYNGY